MMSTIFSQKAIVYIYLAKDGYVPAGTLECFPWEKRSAFRYGTKYLRRSNALPIDPVRLPLLDIQFHTPQGQEIFNVFRDAAPDKWGRRVLSVMAGTNAETMSEFEVLTAMHPQNRVGALAFGRDPFSGPHSMAPWYADSMLTKTVGDIDLIARYVRFIDEAEDENLEQLREQLPDDEFLRAMATSLSPVGGARPKALVRHTDEEWIAKFPKRGDIWNEPLIEHSCLQLAKKCGISVADSKILRSDECDVLLVKRFDRDESGNPLHFVSGFTVSDVFEDAPWGSYQSLSNAARRHGAAAGEELFRRMVFNVLCVNTDDHPRNHAFFVARSGLSITPAYDIVPCRFRFKNYELALGVGKLGNTATLENALSEPAPFGLTTSEANEIVHEMLCTFETWPQHFKALGVSERDIDELAKRFERPETKLTYTQRLEDKKSAPSQ